MFLRSLDRLVASRTCAWAFGGGDGGHGSEALGRERPLLEPSASALPAHFDAPLRWQGEPVLRPELRKRFLQSVFAFDLSERMGGSRHIGYHVKRIDRHDVSGTFGFKVEVDLKVALPLPRLVAYILQFTAIDFFQSDIAHLGLVRAQIEQRPRRR